MPVGSGTLQMIISILPLTSIKQSSSVDSEEMKKLEEELRALGYIE